jgi:D-cysteine desulfhydrase
MLKHTVSKNLVPVTFPWFPTLLAGYPRISLANLPTPLEELCRFSQVLGGPEIFVKRDDLTGFATGGNKARKLEFLLGDALKDGADAIITGGGPQSNHCRQTAAAAARCGLESHVVFGGEWDSPVVGNLFLDQLFGASIHWTPKDTREQKMAEVKEELLRQGKRPYVIPVGGSNAIGALGYVAAMYELHWQLEQVSQQFDYLVFATSSGGTQAGLVMGAKLTGLRGSLIPISIDQVPDDASSFRYKEFVFRIAESMKDNLGLHLDLSLDDFHMNYDYLGRGYGVMGDAEREAIRLLARTEGILVDPVYAGRALAGLISLVRQHFFTPGDRILFWHTGGETALHAYVEELVGR